MLLKANIRLAITGALLVILLGSLQGCMNDPTGPVAGNEDGCIWVDGVLICS